MVEKETIRREALAVRNALEPKWRAEMSELIMDKVIKTELYEKADIILSYSAIRSEVETMALNQKVLQDGKKLYLPKTYPSEKKMCFYPVENLDELEFGYQGILEPPEKEPLEKLLENVSEKDETFSKADILMLMPGAAFDEKGYRMGYGGGYYDRYLNQYGNWINSVLIAFDEQKMTELPIDEYDRKPDYIVTQGGKANKVYFGSSDKFTS